jgi:hypothetical protein
MGQGGALRRQNEESLKFAGHIADTRRFVKAEAGLTFSPRWVFHGSQKP